MLMRPEPTGTPLLWKLGLPAAGIVAVVAVVAVFVLLRAPATPIESTSTGEEQMALARTLLDQGQAPRALQVLDEMAQSAGRRPLGEDARLLRLQALDAAGRTSDLQRESAEFLESFPRSARRVDAELLRLRAEVAQAGLSRPDVVRTVEEFVREHPSHPGVTSLEVALARHAGRLGDTSAAHRRLSNLVTRDDLDDKTRREVERELGDLNLQALLRGESPAGRGKTYTVQSGDSIWVIATRNRVTPELLMQVNNITNPRALRVGQTLTVPDLDFSLVCDISRNTLTLYNHGQFVKSFPVRTGRVPGTTPTGEFRILNKKTDPTWRPGDGRVYLPGDPNNELGTRWMSFEGDILGIHGTVRPETVGHYSSNGCIGMKREDVEELFDIVMVGTPLKIIGQQDTTRFDVIPERQIPAPMTESQIAQLAAR
jgi:lipoprotein-anchoring transpeptidase ErfK/SrfK